ncbi:unnamed protein product [Vicia faba]|uniref:Protein kinase domain-containing protein n=1 Tax=Vicia faba TaxID=3906 RepID=A0AAV0YJU3_VICFA|nr:unnamed protein product [Vicia faba]
MMFLSKNKFGSKLYDLIGNLAINLNTLDLRDNQIYGVIPERIGQPTGLTYLTIGNNSLEGSIPNSIGKLTNLVRLVLQENNLSVPKKGVFSNVTKVSLIGNKKFCGGISQLKLPPCLKVPSKKHKRSLKRKLIIISVFGGILISFIAFIIVQFLLRKSKKLPSSPSLQNRALRVTYGELHEAFNGFSSANLVGTGSFGSVYKGSPLNFERPIAIKVLNLETRGVAKSFMAECNALGKMKH